MLSEIVQILENKKIKIEEWYESKLLKKNRCLYSSVDIRFSGNKLAPVDTNLFPAGFNNLDNNELNQAKVYLKDFLQDKLPISGNIILVSEDHTRNLSYIDNIKTIQNLIISAGYNCFIGSLGFSEKLLLNGHIYKDVEIYPLEKINQKIQIKDLFCPDLVILNNDLMLGADEKLLELSHTIVPDIENGWFKRRKSRHFEVYNQLMNELETEFLIPSSFFSTQYSVCKNIDFKNKDSLEELHEKCSKLLLNITEGNKKNKVIGEPYLVIKSNYGTYGMGVMIIKNPDDIFMLNKKTRNQMNTTKNSIKNTEVIIQEGVSTIDVIDGASSEPLLYLINHQIVSFMYRSHASKDAYGNLNSAGMTISKSKNYQSYDYKVCCEFVARIATLAAANEN